MRDNSKSKNDKGKDKIKRSMQKNGIMEGELNITDIECLNKSLKFRQFTRANKY
jgi:hypothetical protein